MKNFYTSLSLKKLIAPLVFFFLFFTWISNVNSQSAPTLSLNRIYAPASSTGCGAFDPDIIVGTLVSVDNLNRTAPLENDSVDLCQPVFYEWESCIYSTFPAAYVVHDVANTQSYDPPTLFQTTYYRRWALVNCAAPDSVSAQSLGPKVTIYVYPNPTNFFVNGSTTVCPGISTDVTTTGSQTGTNYQYTLYKDNVAVPGSMQYGTGSGLTWSVSDPSCGITHKYTVHSKIVSPLCEGFMSDTATITWQDINAPVWNEPPYFLDRSVECSDNQALTDAQELYPTATDNCSGINYYKTSGQFVSGTCGLTGTYTNSWIAVDACNNTSDTYYQVITITDHTAPVLTGTPYAGQTGLSACMSGAFAVAPFNPFDATLGYTDNCDQYVTAFKTDSTVTGYDCNWTVTYTFTIKDACGNELPGQTYSNSGSDQTAPTLIPGNLWPDGESNINACMSSNAIGKTEADIAALYEDNCGGTVYVTKSTTGVIGTDCQWSITYSYLVEDLCHNGFTKEITYSGSDQTIPELTGTPYAGTTNNHSCRADAEATAPFSASDAIQGYTDNCGAAVTAQYWYADVTGDNCNWAVTYHFSVYDACGNHLDNQTYTNTGYDNVPPQLVSAPVTGLIGVPVCQANAFTAVPFNANMAAAHYYDLCGGPVTAVATDSVVTGTDCDWTLTYTFSVFDECHNELANQTYSNSGSDQTAPNLIPGNYWPNGEYNINACMSTNASGKTEAEIAALYEDNCLGTVYVTKSTTGVSGTDCNWHIQYDYRIEDACHNGFTNSITYAGSDQTKPELTGTPYAGTTNNHSCQADAEATAPFSASDAIQGYTDNCGAAVRAEYHYRDVTGDDCSWAVTYHFSIVDACGNHLDDQTYTNTGYDIVPPQLLPTSNWPSDESGINACRTTNAAGKTEAEIAALYSDNCHGQVFVTKTTSGVTGMDCSWSITYDYLIEDGCHNGFTNSITYSGSDQTPPNLIPGNYWPYNEANIDACMSTNASGKTEAEIAALYEDNCGGTVYVTKSTTGVTGSDCQWSITYSYLIEDECHNGFTNYITYTGYDQTRPELTGTPYAGTTNNHSCKANAEATAPFSASDAIQGYTDNCGAAVRAEYNYADVTGDNCNWAVTYHFTIYDACGNHLDDQTYTNTGYDNEPPRLISVPVTGVTGVSVCKANAFTAVPFNAYMAAMHYYDLCGGPVTAVATDSVVTGTDCDWTLTYTFSVFDECHNELANQSYSNSGSDQTPPNLIPGNLWPDGESNINDCATNYPVGKTEAEIAALYEDNCLGTVYVTKSSVNGLEGNNCEWQITYSYLIEDACHNGFTKYITYSGGDQTAPTLIGSNVWPSDESGINECMSAYPVGKTEAEIAALYEDNCGGLVNVYKTTNGVSGDNCGWSITYDYRIEDVCFNGFTHSITYSGSDQIPPTFTKPSDITIYKNGNCETDSDPIYTGDVTDESDNCTLTGLNATYSDNVVPGACPGTYTINRTWHLEDACMNAANDQVQYIYVVDTLAPSFYAPANITINTDATCHYDADTTITGSPYGLHDNCTPVADLLKSFNDNITQGVCPGSFTIERTWRITDCSGNWIEHMQEIFVRDITPPTAHIADYIRCANLTDTTYKTVGSEFDGTYSDNCGVTNDWYNLSGATTGFTYTTLANVVFNEGVTQVIFTVSDCAGNLGHDTSYITIHRLPRTHIIGEDSVCCGISHTYCDATAYPNDGFTYQWTISGGTILNGGNSPCVEVKWSCNCTSGWLSLTKTNRITGCVKTTDHFNVTIMPTPTPVINGNTTVYANANNEYYSVANCVPGHLYSWTVTGGGIITSTISAGHGICGIYVNWNYADTCSGCRGRVCVIETSEFGCEGQTCINVRILPVPGAFKLKGQVTYFNTPNTPLNGVTVQLLKAGVVVATTTTATYIDESDIDNPVEVLGYYEFGGLNPDTYTLRASTTKPWGGVTATDALLIKLHTIGTINPSIGLPLSGLPLVAANPNLSTPLPGVNATDALLLQLRIVGLVNQFAAGDWVFGLNTVTVSGNTTYNFNALATGDVNKSYVPAIGYKSIVYTNLQKEGITMANNSQEIELPIRVNDVFSLGAVTLDLSYNNSLVDVTGLTSQLSGFEYNIMNGKVMLAWSNTTPVTLSANDALVTLKVKAKGSITASDDIFGFGNNSEFADGDGTILNFNNLKVSSLETGAKDYGFSIYPNPFTSNTEIDYTMIESGNVKIALYNVVGQKMEVLTDESKAAGNYKFNFNASELPVGVYSCEIIINGQTSDYVKVVKLVKTK